VSKKYFFFFFIVFTISVGFFSACEKDSPAQKNIPITGLILHKERLVLEIGNEEALIVTVLPDDATSKM